MKGRVRAALICLACDIAASRKLAGFVGHSALKGCSKCFKSFPMLTFGEKPNYSGFDRDQWPKRDISTQKKSRNAMEAGQNCHRASLHRKRTWCLLF